MPTILLGREFQEFDLAMVKVFPSQDGVCLSVVAMGMG